VAITSSGNKTLIDFEGSISYATMERLLNKLRASAEFQEMGKPARKRLYGTVVESIDNIFKYGVGIRGKSLANKRAPMLNVVKKRDHFVVSAGNMVRNEDVEDLKFRLDRVNQLDDEALKTLYEDIINKESSDEDRGAGLGLITIAMRSDHEIKYSFTMVDNDHSFFKMQIIING
jgi:hypothetical protein